jgi:hypothetical protein
MLPKSATMESCLRGRSLLSFGADLLDEDEEQQVWLYVTPDFADWIDGELTTLQPLADCELTPLEEVESFLRVLMLRKRASGQLARLRPTAEGVWEVKTHQSRLFGWFVRPLHLVLCAGCPIIEVKGAEGAGYSKYYSDVKLIRKRLRLDYAAGDIARMLPAIGNPGNA